MTKREVIDSYTMDELVEQIEKADVVIAIWAMPEKKHCPALIYQYDLLEMTQALIRKIKEPTP